MPINNSWPTGQLSIIREQRMELKQLADRVWIAEYEEERDRPNLGYVLGEHWSLAVDAGHSSAHVEDFYRALEREDLPLPSLTVLTHWHWDHTFGMHCIHGLSLSSRKTGRYLRAFRERLLQEGEECFFSLHPSIRAEYVGGRAVTVVPPDMEYEGSVSLDAGNLPVRVFQAGSPHTDDSSLIFLPEEKILFLGDAPCGVFPGWEVDPVRAGELIRVIENTGAELCVSGHWEVQPRDKLIAQLREE